jgi:DNA/RNA endonuclease YhcR with UshA esterase domain
MTSRLRYALLAAAFLAAAVPAAAHHAVQTVFDLNKPVTVTGTITSMEWTNPHSYIMLDARGDKGAVQHWTFELPGPATLKQSGLNPANHEALKPGDVLTIEGIAAKDGRPLGFVYTLRLANRVIDLPGKQSRAR